MKLLIKGLLLLFISAIFTGCVGSMKADMQLAQENWSEAIPLYHEALQKSPDSNYAKSKLGFCYLKTNQIDDSIKLFEEVLNNDPADSFSVFYLGVAYLNKSEFSKTLEVWKTFKGSDKPLIQEEITRLIPVVMMTMSQHEAKKALASEKKLGGLSSGDVDKNSIAVTYFADNSPDKSMSAFQKGLTAMVISELTKVNSLKVVERSRLQALLEEMKLGQMGIVDKKTAPRIGKLLKAENIVAGTLTKGSIVMAASIASSTSGEVKGTTSVKVEVDQFYTLPALLIAQYAEILNIKLSEAELIAIGVPQTKSLKALTYYGQALDALDAGDWQKAKDFFTLAVREDPLFGLAQIGKSSSPGAGAPSILSIKALDISTISESIDSSFEAANQEQATADEEAEAAAAGGGGGCGC